jgi:hypothetical protein
MRFPLMLDAPAKAGTVSAKVRVPAGTWKIECDCPNTTVAITLDNDEQFHVITPERTFTVDKLTFVQLRVEKSTSRQLNAYVYRPDKSA